MTGASSASAVDVRLVGRFAVIAGGQQLSDHDVGTRKARTLLKVLAARGTPCTVDVLASALWTSDPPRDPGDNVATLVSRLRGVLGADVVVGDRRSWRLGPEVGVDLRRAAALVEEAAWRASEDQPTLSRAAADSALAILGEDARLLLDEPGLPDWAEEAQRGAEDLLSDARHLAANAALSLGDASAAMRYAQAAWASDGFDEQAVRTLMLASRATGETSRGLAAYARLRELLVEDLGSDPAEETRTLHLELLSDQPVPIPDLPGSRQPEGPGRPAAPQVRRDADTVVGRERERARITELWAAAADGRPSVVLVAGEGGIGKSTLAAQVAEVARSTGGEVLEARCYEAERSMFLQPVLEALRPPLLRSTGVRLRELAGDRAAPLARLLPDLAGLLDDPRGDHANPDTERRLAYESLVGVIRRLSVAQPLLLVLDDLHQAGLATLEFLHLLARQAGSARLLVLATVRTEEGAAALRTLRDLAERIDVGPLGAADVHALAAAYGRADLGEDLLARTRGHPLFVVETLRSLSAGDVGIPRTLTATVESRLDAAETDDQDAIRAASVLGPAFDPDALAELLAADPVVVVQRCERLADARLLARAGHGYEFANDLVQEAVYAGTSEPLRATYHRRAAELFGARPEVAAGHRAALGDWTAAAGDWLRAAEQASTGFATADAEQLLSCAVDAARRAGSGEITALALLERGRVRVTLEHLAGALEDLTDALALAQAEGVRTIEVRTQRELAGDVLIGLGRPLSACEPHLEGGLRVARQVGDAIGEADLLARGAVLATNRLQLDRALSQGLRAVSVARRSGDERALMFSLDGLKAVYAYTGDVVHLTEVINELDPLCRSSNDLSLLQWCALERSFVPLAAGRWAEARGDVEEALDLNRRSGWTSFEAWFVTHLSWVLRLSGDIDAAVVHGRRAVALGAATQHSWWDAYACSGLAASLAAQDAEGQAEEIGRLLRRGLASADRSGAEAYRLRCVAGLAEATGSADALGQADQLMRGIRRPAGWTWMHGLDAYLSLAKAWVTAGDTVRARAVLMDVVGPGSALGWGPVLDSSGAMTLLAELDGSSRPSVPRQKSSASRPAARAAPSDETGR